MKFFLVSGEPPVARRRRAGEALTGSFGFKHDAYSICYRLDFGLRIDSGMVHHQPRRRRNHDQNQPRRNSKRCQDSDQQRSQLSRSPWQSASWPQHGWPTGRRVRQPTAVGQLPLPTQPSSTRSNATRLVGWAAAQPTSRLPKSTRLSGTRLSGTELPTTGLPTTDAQQRWLPVSTQPSTSSTPACSLANATTGSTTTAILKNAAPNIRLDDCRSAIPGLATRSDRRCAAAMSAAAQTN